MLEPLRKISAAIQRRRGRGRAHRRAVPARRTGEPGDRSAGCCRRPRSTRSKVKLIGTGGMDYPNAGRDAELVGAWYPAPDPRGWNEFSQKYAKTYGQAPPRIASLAYDAVSLAIALSGGRRGPALSRAAQLTRASGFTGIDGAFRLLPDGTRRPLARHPRGAEVRRRRRRCAARPRLVAAGRDRLAAARRRPSTSISTDRCQSGSTVLRPAPAPRPAAAPPR